MRIEKLPSGSYRVRKMIEGKSVSIVFDHKPTEREIEREVTRKMRTAAVRTPRRDKLTFRKAAETYLEMKKNVLKPNTYREYSNTCDRLDAWFVDSLIDDIDQIMINRQINDLSAKRKPKTVRNYHAFIAAILGTFRPDIVIHTTLPQKERKHAYVPSDDEVKAVVKELEGTMFYIPIVLASLGMRRGEICALTVDDLEGDVVHITKSLAKDVNKNWVIDTPKTTDSNRDITIPMSIADMIREQGFVYQGHPNSITSKLYKIQKKLGIQQFSVHKMRHYFASALHAKGIPDADIIEMGGWSSDYVMKSVYRHSMIDKQTEAKRNAMSLITQNILSE